jgi:hypothetical protein
MEWTATSKHIPYFTRYFRQFADFNLAERYKTPFSNWYACANSMGDCLGFQPDGAVKYDTSKAQGTIANYVPACGNVHFAPNSRNHYDDVSPVTVQSTCRAFRTSPPASDPAQAFTTAEFEKYNQLAPDCGGGWQVWWRQSMPGWKNAARDDQGEPMLSWWPFLFY